jgi:hypothetical protein
MTHHTSTKPYHNQPIQNQTTFYHTETYHTQPYLYLISVGVETITFAGWTIYKRTKSYRLGDCVSFSCSSIHSHLFLLWSLQKVKSVKISTNFNFRGLCVELYLAVRKSFSLLHEIFNMVARFISAIPVGRLLHYTKIQWASSIFNQPQLWLIN